jgi:serpin B
MNRQKPTVVVFHLVSVFTVAWVVAVAGVFALPTAARAEAAKKNADEAMAAAKSCNAFATDLYARLSSDEPTNLFFSPYSVSVALAMTYAGAAGDTQAQMAKVLHLATPGAKVPPAGEVAKSFGRLAKLLESRDKNSGYRLRVANRLWGQQGFHFMPTFLGLTKDNFGAELGLLDFRQADAARETINRWIAEQTDDKIQDLIAAGVLTDNTRLVLTNAIYFKARWTHEFEKADTTDAPFHTSATAEITVPTMHQSERLRYAAADEMQMLELPYGADHSLSMLILLPKKVDGLADLERRLTSDNLQKWSKDLKPRLVEVDLPRFKMTAQFSLSDTLKAMGMPLAFSGNADFSGMSTQKRLLISAVIHKAFVDVNEEGTEAAAATAIAIADMAMPPTNDKVTFRADHPFAFLIRDRRAESILFLGRVNRPEAK